MICSVFDLFKIGLGPSSSHTVGPMVAARCFCERLATEGRLESVAALTIKLFGSLALTGSGHGTPRAVVCGLAGLRPETAEPDAVAALDADARATRTVRLLGRHPIDFPPEAIDLRLSETLAQHSNAMRFIATDGLGHVVRAETWYSIGGGFVLEESDLQQAADADDEAALPVPFTSMADLLAAADQRDWPIWRVMLTNETARHGEPAVWRRLTAIREAMLACLARGLAADGTLPGRLKVSRRARGLYEGACARHRRNDRPPHAFMDFVSAYAMAVNEENAAGHRVVTAPTNGAAGVIPAVLRYYEDTVGPEAGGRSPGGSDILLLTAGAIGALCKRNASISGAEAGCQGEVGVAAAMAAAGLVAAFGGSNRQVENAAEIALEHHLGLTCDPVGGLVQIPCIERNSMGAVKAINAASLALAGNGMHRVSLDTAIETMRQTGADMAVKYKETSLGGLAVNVVEC